jgi:hypothetical protein
VLNHKILFLVGLAAIIAALAVSCGTQPADPCAANPCQNGGTCKVDTAGTGYICTCATGYSGTNCETHGPGVDAGPGVDTGSKPDTGSAPLPDTGTVTEPDSGTDKADTGTATQPDTGAQPDVGTAEADAGTAAGPDASAGKCGTSTLVTYSIQGKFDVSQTPGSAGDFTADLPGTAVRTGGTPLVDTPSTVVLRFHADGTHVALVSLDYAHNVHSTKGADIYQNILHSVPKNECGVATGTLSGTTLTWDTCTPPATYGTTKWATSELAVGAGCATLWGDVGNLYCGSGAICTLGKLQSGDNPVTRPPEWPEPLSKFVFTAADLKTFSADYFQVPNDKKNAISRISITQGTDTGRTTEVTPDCACP